MEACVSARSTLPPSHFFLWVARTKMLRREWMEILFRKAAKPDPWVACPERPKRCRALSTASLDKKAVRSRIIPRDGQKEFPKLRIRRTATGESNTAWSSAGGTNLDRIDDMPERPRVGATKNEMRNGYITMLAPSLLFLLHTPIPPVLSSKHERHRIAWRASLKNPRALYLMC